MKSYKNCERKEIIDGQDWSKETLAHLMEYFIEYNELGEEFTQYLAETAERENREANPPKQVFMVVNRKTGKTICAFDSLLGVEEYIFNNDSKILEWETLELYEDE